jgi:hypothetical protein
MPLTTMLKERNAVRHQIVTELPPKVKPLSEEERKQALKVLGEADQLRMAMLKRRKGRLLPDSTSMIRQSRDEELA